MRGTKAQRQSTETALGPQLCCEKSGLTAEEAAVLVADVVRSWERDLVLCFLYRGSEWRGCIVTVDGLVGHAKG